MRHFGQAIWADEAVRLAEKPSEGLFVRRTDDDAAHQRPKALPRPLPSKMRVAATTSPIPVPHRAEGPALCCCFRPVFSPNPASSILPGHICADGSGLEFFTCLCARDAIGESLESGNFGQKGKISDRIILSKIYSRFIRLQIPAV